MLHAWRKWRKREYRARTLCAVAADDDAAATATVAAAASNVSKVISVLSFEELKKHYQVHIW